MMYAEELIHEGRTDLLEQLLTQKFGPLPPAYRDRLLSATEEQFARYSRRLLEADSLDAVFAD
jgi:hypothetical protein